MEQSHRQTQCMEHMMQKQQEVTDRTEQAAVRRQLSYQSVNLDPSSATNKVVGVRDSFECTFHRNTKLTDKEKFSYIRRKLGGEAKRAISGLLLCNENYWTAVYLLRERFWNKHDITDTHYSKIMNIAQPYNNVHDMGYFLDQYEKHIRSLEVLRENINQNIFVSMIKFKIPKEVLQNNEIRKEAGKEWTYKELLNRLRTYIVACERSEQKNVQYKNEANLTNSGAV